MTTPTDSEIEAAWTEATGSSILPYPDEMLAFARAVLAKWGQPQAGASGEPVAWMVPKLQTFKGATRVHFTRAPGCTMTDAELIEELEGRVMWLPQSFSDCPDGVVDKFGVKHFPKPLYTAPPPQAVREALTEREIELIDGMIAVQLDHAARCDAIANRAMAEKQKGWDMERVELLRKLKAGQTGRGHLSFEQHYAIRQGHEIAASEAYFTARPQIDTNDRRKVFQAGFERGWDAAGGITKGGQHGAE